MPITLCKGGLLLSLLLFFLRTPTQGSRIIGGLLFSFVEFFVKQLISSGKKTVSEELWYPPPLFLLVTWAKQSHLFSKIAAIFRRKMWTLSIFSLWVVSLHLCFFAGYCNNLELSLMGNYMSNCNLPVSSLQLSWGFVERLSKLTFMFSGMHKDVSWQFCNAKTLTHPRTKSACVCRMWKGTELTFSNYWLKCSRLSATIFFFLL